MPGLEAHEELFDRSEYFFDDIDAQAASLNGWQLDYMQLSTGAFKGAVHRIDLGGVRLVAEDLHQSVYQEGLLPPHIVALGIPIYFQGEALFCGRPGTVSDMYFFSGSNGFEFRSPRRQVMVNIEIDAALFQSLVQADDAETLPASLTAHLHTLRKDTVDSLRRSVLELFAGVARNADVLSHAAQSERAREMLLERLGLGLACPCDAARARQQAPTPRQLALERRARDLIQCCLQDPPTVEQMCQALNVSHRSLQSCFNAVWGIGPHRYLNIVRLNAARRKLKTVPRVTEVATEFGFWHFGHFSSDYKALFGESPSATACRYQGQFFKGTRKGPLNGLVNGLLKGR